VSRPLFSPLEVSRRVLESATEEEEEEEEEEEAPLGPCAICKFCKCRHGFWLGVAAGYQSEFRVPGCVLFPVCFNAKVFVIMEFPGCRKARGH
jgi:hypothetical protein